MAKIIKLTESDLRRIVKRVIKEQKIDQAKNVGLGFASGAAMGATAGSVVPIVGTAIGAGVGGAVGALTTAANQIINGSGTSDQKVKQFVELCAKSNSPITANSNKLADEVRDAVQGLGTNEKNIYGIFGGALDKTRVKTMEEFCSVVKSYQASYDVSLYDDLDGDIDEESVWVQIFRPLRDIALRDQQNQKPVAQPTSQPKPQGVVNSAAQAAKTASQPTQGGPRPTSPTSRMPVR